MSHDLRCLKSIQLSDHGTTHVGVVLVDNTYRHLYRLSSVHQGGEEKDHHHREDDRTEPVDRMPPHDDQFTDKDVVDASYRL